MIRPLRKRHFNLIVLVALIVTLVFWAGMRSRSTVPAEESVPPLAANSEPELNQLWSKPDLWPELGLVTAVSHEAKSAAYWLQMRFNQDPKIPGLLIYWLANEAGSLDGVPGGAHLLGSLRGNAEVQFQLPVESVENPGYLFLYSLGRGEGIAQTALPAFGQAAQTQGEPQ